MAKTQANKRPYIFIIVGIVNTLLDFAFYTLLTTFVFKSNDIGVAGIISGTFALLCAFTTHSLVTWRDSHITKKTLAKFIIFTGFGMWVIRPLLLIWFIKLHVIYDWVERICQSVGLPFKYDFISHSGAFVFMAIILLIYNYSVYDRFVFSDKNKATSDIEPESH